MEVLAGMVSSVAFPWLADSVPLLPVHMAILWALDASPFLQDTSQIGDDPL